MGLEFPKMKTTTWPELSSRITALSKDGSPRTRRALERAIFKLVQDQDRLRDSHNSLVATLDSILAHYERSNGIGFSIPGLREYKKFVQIAKRLGG